MSQISYMFLEHAMGGGIGDHDRGEIFGMSFGLDAQIIDVKSPRASQATTTTSMPAMMAEAGLVPWAEEGSGTPCGAARRARRDSRGSPVVRHISPCAPELGCSEIAS